MPCYFIFIYKKTKASHLVLLSLLMAGVDGFASLEPPAKQSTGLFFHLAVNTQTKVCLLLIRIHLLLYDIKQKQTLLGLLLYYVAGVDGYEPTKWRSQSPLPYRLAIPLFNFLCILPNQKEIYKRFLYILNIFL